MNGTQKIRQALKALMTAGEANAARIDKGYFSMGGRYGWHYVPFGKSAVGLGETIDEALETIARMAEERGNL